MRRVLILALGGGFLAGAVLAQGLPEGDPARGETLMPQCRTCHGADGLARAINAPNIAGESATYLAGELADFRDGVRVHEQMSVVAQALSDQDIADLAAWYASQTVTATLTADAADAPEDCVACHGADGIAVIDDAPHLAGDSEMVLAAALHAFRDGTRQSEIMSGIAADLTDADIKALAKWYSRVRLAVE